jgi:hypothetical protein
MGYELPYIGYAYISRCEKRAGDTQNKTYDYSAQQEKPVATNTQETISTDDPEAPYQEPPQPKNGHYGSLDFIKFDPTVPNNSNNPLISFKLTGGRFVERSTDPLKPLTNPVIFNADIEALNVPVVNIPPCKPR